MTIKSSPRPLGLTGSIAMVVGCLLGCESTSPPPSNNSETKVTVSGTVTVDGKAINGGTINFDPANASRPMAPMASTRTDSTGKYSVQTLVGPNRINVTHPDLKRGGGGEQFEVKDGSNEHDIALTNPK